MQLLPVLKSASWHDQHPDDRAHVWIGSPAEPLVLVTYAHHDDSGELTFVTVEECPPDRTDDLVSEAFDNLEYYHTDFEMAEADGDRMLISAGWPFAAERVMCESHMLRAHEKLDSEEIVVSITKRGTMLVCSLDCSEGTQATMTKLHGESWAAAGDDRIVDELVVVRHGTKSGTLAVTIDEDGAYAPSWGPSPG